MVNLIAIPETFLIFLFILGQLAAEIEKPSNPFVPLLNVIGVFGSGVLGSLYGIARKEKIAADMALESVSSFFTCQIFSAYSLLLVSSFLFCTRQECGYLRSSVGGGGALLRRSVFFVL